MTKHNGANERIKREYFAYLKQAMGRDEATIDGVAKSLARFEVSTRARDFKRFHREQAVAFKHTLANAINARTGERMSKSTVLSTMRDLRAFFFWLAHLPGFKKQIAYADADYFNLSDKDVAVARAQREKRVPTLEQVHHVLSVMPADTVLARRNRALFAFAAMTAARAGALASFRLGHLNLDEGYIDQDARTVRTKFSKTFRTFLMPIGGEALAIVADWAGELARDHHWGSEDPLFPSTQMGLNDGGGFHAVGILRTGWNTAQPVNTIFRRAFEGAGLPYHNPHSFRDMLVRHAMRMDLTPEAMKAWSQNVGHKDVLTTLTSYGQVPVHRQGELIRAAGRIRGCDDWMSDADVQTMLKVLAARLQEAGRAGLEHPRCALQEGL
ncbi:tyrosine-type recombinase/integrase [Sphingomonas koreensis]